MCVRGMVPSRLKEKNHEFIGRLCQIRLDGECAVAEFALVADGEEIDAKTCVFRCENIWLTVNGAKEGIVLW